MEMLNPSDPQHIGPYTLLGRLGEGAMGAVFLGRSAGRTVAVKLISPGLAHDDGFRARFRAEVAAARAVPGAFTAPVVDADPDAEVPWMATAFVPGISLHQAVMLAGPLPEPAVRALAAGIAGALVDVHAAGLTHRDLKPGNVLLALDGPHVIDFGIARAADATALTAARLVPGTPPYMSPEQAMGHEVTPASDVFSLGSTLAFAARGSDLFGTGEVTAVLRRVVHDEPDLSALSDRLRLMVAACLSKNPADRPSPRDVVAFVEQDARPMAGAWLPPVLIAAIEQAAAVMAPSQSFGPGAAPAVAPTPPPPPPFAPPAPLPRPSRRKLLLGLAGGTLAVAGGGTGLALALWGGSSGKGDGKGGGKPSPSASLTDPARSLANGVVARPLWTAEIGDRLVQLAGAGHTVVAVTGTYIRAYDRSGRALWEPLANQSDNNGYRVGGMGGDSLAVDGSMAYAVSYAKEPLPTRVLRAVDLATGTVAWTVGRTGASVMTAWVPGMLDGVVYVAGMTMGGGGIGGQSAFVWAVDPKTRQIRWQQDFANPGMSQTMLKVPSSGSRLLYMDSAPDRSSATLTGLDITAGGKPAWEQPSPGPQTALSSLEALDVNWHDGPHCSAGGNFLILSGPLYAVDPANGQVAWQAAVQLPLRAFAAAPDGSLVYGAALDYPGHGLVYAFDAKSGTVRWAGQVPVASPGTVAIQCADGQVYVWINGKVWALDAATGAGRWSFEFAVGSPTDVSRPVAFWAGGGQVYGAGPKGLVALSASGK
ncbi:serine/threonine-protein kinase [Streptomyces sp. NBC_00536]|uniref:protein kinase domain-containing protein n=1 Tax=Streptomyces sp. NBC_00536 TaxID=2975769 RepID=UPI002E823716|nr:PQQ-binding-like beta-propeller repeat protein [Streptomyces sp. NBC_00536]WUC83267.1 serine/threonine-protein kinase [Streptomyces sp. NBC_00536]